MTFTADAGKIEITNTAGDVVFDTDEGLFVVTDRLSGTITLPTRASSNGPNLTITGREFNADYLLGPCNTSATAVRGVFRATVPGGQGNVTNIGAFNANGTYMHYSDGNPNVTGGTFTDNVFVANLAAYTFYPSAGAVFLRENVVLCGAIRLAQEVYTITLRPPTFSYNLFIGTFV